MSEIEKLKKARDKCESDHATKVTNKIAASLAEYLGEVHHGGSHDSNNPQEYFESLGDDEDMLLDAFLYIIHQLEIDDLMTRVLGNH